jgi:hypothetical protein
LSGSRLSAAWTAEERVLAATRREAQPTHPEGIIRILGYVLVGAGLIALVFGGFSYSKRRETVAIGPLQASIREQERVSVPPILGAIAVIAGVGLIVMSSKKRKGK